MTRRKLKPPPEEVYVYYCATCGNPQIADLRPYATRSCAICPVGQEDVRFLKYVPRPVKPRRKR